MNSKGSFGEASPIYLRASIIEAVLLSCITESSFFKINQYVQRVVPTSNSSLRKYIFHLIDNAFISYNGDKKTYAINSSGLKLLDIIYSLQNNGPLGYTDLVIKIN